MRRSFLIMLATILIFSSSLSIINLQVTYKNNNIHYVNENLYLTNKNQKFVEDKDFINLSGDHFGTTYRIYMNSDGDKFLPAQANSNDYLVGKGNKNNWYNHLIYGLSSDVTNYAFDKTEFLNKYKSVSVTYSYMYNFWNGLNGWTNKYEKNLPFSAGVYTFNLKASNEAIELFQATDINHSSNEKVRLILEISWNGNILNINWQLGVWYSWSWASVFNHAVLAGFLNDNYLFLKIPKDETKPNASPRIDNIIKSSTFSLLNANKVSGLSDVDSVLKDKAQQEEIKNSIFKIAPVLVQGYTGVKTITVPQGVWIYTLGVFVTWFLDSEVVIDSNMILRVGINIDRLFEIEYTGNLYRFIYKSFFNEYTNYQAVSSEFSGMKLIGAMTVPYIYLT